MQHHFLVDRNRRWVSSARSATWCSTTSQLSALTTTRRMLRAAADRNILTPGTSARFAAGSSRTKAIWNVTCQQFMVLVTSRLFSVTFAQKSTHRNLISRCISQVYTLIQAMPQRFSVTSVQRYLGINDIWKDIDVLEPIKVYNFARKPSRYKRSISAVLYKTQLNAVWGKLHRCIWNILLIECLICWFVYSSGQDPCYSAVTDSLILESSAIHFISIVKYILHYILSGTWLFGCSNIENMNMSLSNMSS